MYKIKVYSWTDPFYFSGEGLDLKAGDSVIVETNFGKELSEIIGVAEQDSCKSKEHQKNGSGNGRSVEYKFIRKANVKDIVAFKKCNSKKREVKKVFRSLASKYNLPMKFVDVHFGFEGSHIIFVFICETKVDFREMVKEMARKFQKSIRLQQIGSRDNSKRFDCYGMCGRELCCRLLKCNLGGINTEMAKVQGLDHRSCERISGICSRLMCCLSFEAEQYEEMFAKTPKIGDEVKLSKGGKGKVVNLFLLEQAVEVELENKNREKILLKDLK